MGTQLPPLKGHSSPLLFDPCLLWPQSRISATAELLFLMKQYLADFQSVVIDAECAFDSSNSWIMGMVIGVQPSEVLPATAVAVIV